MCAVYHCITACRLEILIRSALSTKNLVMVSEGVESFLHFASVYALVCVVQRNLRTENINNNNDECCVACY